jgi:hypothetical protein
MATLAERMRALLERQRPGFRSFTIGVSKDDLRVIAEHGYALRIAAYIKVEDGFVGRVCPFGWAMSGARMAILGSAPGNCEWPFCAARASLGPACQRRKSISVSPKRAWK